MIPPLVNAAIGLAELVPSITRWFTPDKDKIAKSQRVAERVVGIAKAVTGAHDAVDAMRILEKDPGLLIRFQQEVLRLDMEIERLYQEDRQDARSRDIAFINSGRYNFRADIMVVAAAFGLCGCLGCLTYFKDSLPGEAVGIISTIAGIFGSCLKDAYAFEFGSSRGSKAKDAAVFFNSRER